MPATKRHNKSIGGDTAKSVRFTVVPPDRQNNRSVAIYLYGHYIIPFIVCQRFFTIPLLKQNKRKDADVNYFVPFLSVSHHFSDIFPNKRDEMGWFCPVFEVNCDEEGRRETAGEGSKPRRTRKRHVGSVPLSLRFIFFGKIFRDFIVCNTFVTRGIL